MSLQPRAHLRQAARERPGIPTVADTYQVSVFSHGLRLAYPGAPAAFQTRYEAGPLAALPPPHRLRSAALPDPASGSTFTPSASKATELPTTRLRCRRRSTSIRCFISQRALPAARHADASSRHVLIGLHPSTTQFDLPDGTPGFEGPGFSQAAAARAFRRRQHRHRASAFLPAASTLGPSVFSGTPAKTRW
jgi:hypothetical protein